MTRSVLAAIVVVAAIGIGSTLWINGSRPAPSAAGRDFFAVPQEYPLNGGQELRPRWDAGEGVADEPSN